ncbi:MAG: transporter substrate-binding domain-containing protein [Desulfobacterales bacterium]|nr:transporter substrate-binding domain-containing protein [Desulfobacterales bacterium]
MINTHHQTALRWTLSFRWLFRLIWGAAAVAVFAASVPAAENAGDSTAIIKSGAEIDYPPFSMVNDRGRADGFSVELMRAALAAMGRGVSFRTGPWAQVRGWLERGEVQALPLVGRTPEREALFDFTVPYMSLHGAIVVRNDETGIRDLADLRGRRVAVMKGDNAEEFLRRKERGIRIHTTPTFEAALRELSEGRYDAVVIQRLVALRLIRKTGLTDLRVIARPIEGFNQDFCFSVREGDRNTLALLNEGLAIVVADGTYRRLHAKWFAALQLPADRPIVVGGDRNFPPYEYLDERGRPAGYNVDLTRAIARETGLNVDIRLGRWPERLAALKTGKIVIQGMFYSHERDLDFDFTQAHSVGHCVAVVRKGQDTPPETVEALAGKRIVVEGGDILHDFARAHGLEKQVTAVDDQEEALRQLAHGKHDCALVSRVAALYLIDKNGWANLVPGKKPLLTSEYGYAAAKGQKALLAQFGEGLKALESSGEYQRIHEKWLGVYQEKPASLLTALRYSALVIIPLLVILMLAVLWSWSLRRQVAEKTKALQDSLDRFKYVFDASNIGKSIILPSGEVDVNQAFADFLGYDRNELKGKRWQDLTHPEDMDASEKIIADLLAGEKDADRFEKRYVHKNGTFLWADVSVAIRRHADGRPLYFITTIVDIEARKQAEKALRDREEYQRAMIACSPVALYTVDPHGKVLSWNRSAERIFGWRAEEIIGKPLPIVPNDKQDEFHALRQRVLKGDTFTGKELVRLKKDGTPIPIRLSVARVRNDRGETVGILGPAEDITESKKSEANLEKLQAQLLQAQKMESVGRLAGGVAHDYNNMLSVIIGYAELAVEKIGPEDALYADLQEILNAALRSADITRQLLAFARRQTIHPKLLDLNETVEEMLKMLRRLIGEDIDLSWQPGPDPMPVFMDPSQVDQILANLCVNARDAIGGVGKITIETGRVCFDAEYCADHAGFIPGDFILLALSDDGCGMDRNTLDNIFEPFFTTKDVGEGTGLGLATVYGIVKQNEGFINVYSEPGKGTTFRIYLPCHGEGATKVPAGETAETRKGQGETVLVVEDEAAILKLAQRVLEGLGYRVLAASTPGNAAALARAHAGRIHLLITDVVMPEMNGMDLSEDLRAQHPDLKVLFMSGYTANVIAYRGVLDEGVNLIQKPFSNRDFAVKVRKALEAGQKAH